MKIRQLAQAVAATTAVATAVIAAPAASAATGPEAGETQRQIDRQLARYGGTQTGPNEVSYKGGNVKLVVTTDSSRAAAACPGGWYCFYESEYYGGRRLQFQDCGLTQYLTNYGFGDQTTSWQNTTGHTVYVYDNATFPPTSMWTEEPVASSVFVGDTFDNRADSFYTACAAGAS